MINKATLKLIREFEGCRLEAYKCPAGVWTIGWGHAATSGLEPIPKAGMKITQKEADSLHKADLEVFSQQIVPLFNHKPSPDVFGACLSLAFNIGVGAFRKSTCLKRLNAGDIGGAAQALQWFNKANGKVTRGLVRRRQAEADLMLSGRGAKEDTAATPDPEKTAVSSTTIMAAAGTALSGGAGTVTALSQLEGTSQLAVIVLAFIALAGVAWVMRERLKKLAEGV